MSIIISSMRKNVEVVVTDSVASLDKIFGRTLGARNYFYKIARVLFVIVGGMRPRITGSPIPDKNISIKLSVEIRMSCKHLTCKLGCFYPKEHVYVIVYQTNIYNSYIMPILLVIIISNNPGTLITTYMRSFRWGKEIRVTEELIRKLFKKDLIVVRPINPTSLGMEKLNPLEPYLMDKHGPSIAVFNEAEILVLIHGQREPDRYFMYPRNQMPRQRDLEVMIAVISALVNREFYRKESCISDAVLRFDYVYENSRLVPRVFVWRIGFEPSILYGKEVKKCIDESMKILWGE